jgi:hypothetical protein
MVWRVIMFDIRRAPGNVKKECPEPAEEMRSMSITFQPAMARMSQPTRYAGISFRSRLEARWAMFFDLIGVAWEYEPVRIRTCRITYVPDFRIEDRWWIVRTAVSRYFASLMLTIHKD